MPGRSPQLYCTLTTLIAMQGHETKTKQKQCNCFVHFVGFLLSLKPRPFVRSSLVLRYACAPTATHSLPNNCLPASFFVFVSSFFVCLEMSLFPSILVLLPFSLCLERTSYVFPSRMVFFYLATTGWIFDIIISLLYVRTQSISQSR